MKRRNEIVLAAAVFAVVLLFGTKVLAADAPPAPPFPVSDPPSVTTDSSTSTTSTTTSTSGSNTSTAKKTATTATSGPVETGAILLLGGVAFVLVKKIFTANQSRL